MTPRKNMGDGKKHWDARGHEVHDFLTLLEILDHEPSKEILRQKMLYGVVVHPFVEIRVFTPFTGTVEISFYGTGPGRVITREVTGRGLQALRRFYKTANSRGWTIYPNKGYIAFRRAARVTVDRSNTWGR